MNEEIKLDAFCAHEALDRAHVLTVHLDEILGEHPWITSHPELVRLHGLAMDAVCDLYQAIGRTLPEDWGNKL